MPSSGALTARLTQASAFAAGLLAQWLVHAVILDALFPPFALGDRIVRVTPGAFATLAIERLGAGAHVLLAIVVIVGLVSLAACSTARWWPSAVIAGATIVGVLASPSSVRVAPNAIALMIGVAATSLASWALTPSARDARLDRRRFLGAVVTMAGGFGAALVLQVLPRRATAPVATSLPAYAEDPTIAGVPGISPLITPTDRHYVVSINYEPPRLDANEWRLRLSGRVRATREITLAQLRALGEIRQPLLMQCISNPIGGDLIGDAVWTGVPLERVLSVAGVLDGTVALHLSAADGYDDVLPLAMAADAVIAWGMNDAALPTEHGSPVRLLLPSHYGMRSVKWLQTIEVITSVPEGYWASRGWDPEAAMRPGTRIDTPTSDATVSGTFTVAGVAWAPAGVRSVEVRLDSGEWLPATLEAAAGPLAWQRWAATVMTSPGRRLIAARVTDSAGHVQSEEPLPTHPSGAQGLHRVLVTVA